MPRKKKVETTTAEPISVLKPEIETEEQESESAIAIEELAESVSESEIDSQFEGNGALDLESCSRDYLTATLQSAQASMTDLFEAQAQLAGTQIADKVFDSLEDAFVSRLQQRLQPFVDVLLPEIRDGHAQLRDRTAARVERRQSAFDRIKQIATLVSDECRLSLPNGEPTGNLLGFASWEPTNYDQINKEND
jgi:hypothetical protein